MRRLRNSIQARHESAASISRSLADYFATRRDVALAYLFGSHGEGRAHRESDIDVAVLLDQRMLPRPEDRFHARIALTSDLISLLHCNDTDLLVLNESPPHLARRIVLEGRLVHCADGRIEHAFRRDVQLRAADLTPFLERSRRTKLSALRR